ncbi:MAG: ABC transporter substrate-binding protein [Halomonas sp.]|nr:ABC transporter substrate-binding protein [Halomonas sp.]MDN6297817.1 ABC transporter substrate-binding protein [Halomonas sp.]MDN6315280.1 ABC transporter substrate-binding protein [Halomonas sp.]MDN6336467.1 ABC transporter substrate-binding protein [Halomonas sp.]
MLRYRLGFTLCLLLWLCSAGAGAQPAAPDTPSATDNTTSVLTLDTEVQVPEGLWPAEQVVIKAPSTAISLPEPLSPPPMEPLTLMLDWFLSPQHAPLLIAQLRGLYQEQGLDVMLKPPADPSLPAKLLTAGEVDAALTRQPLLHLNNHDDAGLIRIATLMETSLNAVIVAGDTAPENHTALATRKYGYATREGAELIVPLLVPESVRQTDDYITPRNVHYDGERNLQEGNIGVLADGFYNALPAQLATDGIGSSVVTYAELGLPGHDGLILMVNGDQLKQRKQTWQHLVIALENAARWIVEHPDRAWNTLTEAYPVLDNSANADAWPGIVRRLTLRPGAVDTRRYQRMEAFLQQRGIIQTALPVSSLAVDPHAL